MYPLIGISLRFHHYKAFLLQHSYFHIHLDHLSVFSGGFANWRFIPNLLPKTGLGSLLALDHCFYLYFVEFVWHWAFSGFQPDSESLLAPSSEKIRYDGNCLAGVFHIGIWFDNMDQNNDFVVFSFGDSRSAEVRVTCSKSGNIQSYLRLLRPPWR